MGFKEMVQEDISRVFLNPCEFGEFHSIDGVEIPIVVDNDELKRRQSGEELAIEEATTLFYCRTCDLPKKRKPGQSMNKDGRLCTVADIKDDMGVTTVVLEENIVT